MILFSPATLVKKGVKMKRGFTLLELVVVIVIIGVLATLGIATYTRMIERARGAEARQVLGAIRTQAAALYIGNNNAIPAPVAPTTFNNMMGVGANLGEISSGCAGANAGQYYFSYNAIRDSAIQWTGTATRCTAGGKNPQGPSAMTLTLVSDFNAGTDVWGGTGGY
jgi:prepilin-type N-terminal cleavage/methylation domain-containing protein